MKMFGTTARLLEYLVFLNICIQNILFVTILLMFLWNFEKYCSKSVLILKYYSKLTSWAHELWKDNIWSISKGYTPWFFIIFQKYCSNLHLCVFQTMFKILFKYILFTIFFKMLSNFITLYFCIICLFCVYCVGIFYFKWK